VTVKNLVVVLYEFFVVFQGLVLSQLFKTRLAVVRRFRRFYQYQLE